MARSGGLNPIAALLMLAVVCAVLLMLGAAPAAPGVPTAAEVSPFWRWVEGEVAKAGAADSSRSLLETNAHAVEGHGAKAASVAGSFSADGICSAGTGSVKLREPASGRFILCGFLDAMGSLMRMHVMEEDGTTVTDIPEEHIPKPERYLTNAATKRGYTLEQAWGDIPEWVNRLFTGKLSTP